MGIFGRNEAKFSSRLSEILSSADLDHFFKLPLDWVLSGIFRFFTNFSDLIIDALWVIDWLLTGRFFLI